MLSLALPDKLRTIMASKRFTVTPFVLDVCVHICTLPLRLFFTDISLVIQTAIFHSSSQQPGVTQEWVDSLHPLGGPGRPDDIAQAVLYLTGDGARWITGICLPVDGGYSS